MHTGLMFRGGMPRSWALGIFRGWGRLLGAHVLKAIRVFVVHCGHADTP